MSDSKEVEVRMALTPDEIRALKELAAVYLDRGGPAYECMQEWHFPHSAECLTSLKDKILAV